MKEQERIEQIEAYATGNMSEKDSVAFEQRLLEDVDLANELKAYQELQTFLSDMPKNHFRATLEQIRTERDLPTTKKPSTNQFNWQWIAIITPIILLLLFFFLRSKNDEPSIETPNIESENTKPSDPPIEIEPPTEEEQEPASVPETTKEPKEETPPVIKKSLPIAANFEVNPLLENEMREGLRGGEIEVQLNQPTNNARFAEGENILFSGQLETDYTLEELDLRLLIFTNKVADYQNFESIEEQALILNEDLIFNFISTPTLSKGLYYFIIEDLNEESFLKVGKFEIR